MYNLQQILLYVSSLAAVALAVFVFIKNKKNTVSVSFAGLCAASFLWLFSYARMLTASFETVSVWIKSGTAGMILVPAFSMFFILSFIKAPVKKTTLWVTAVITVIFTGLVLFSDLFINRVNINGWGPYPRAGELHFLFIIYAVSIILFALHKAYKYIKNDDITSIKKYKVIYIILTYCLFAVLFVFDNLFFYNIFKFEPITHLTMLFCLSTAALIISNYNLANLKVLSIKLVIFLFMLLLVLSVTSHIAKFSNNIFLSNLFTFLLTISCFMLYKRIILKAEDLLLAKSKHYQNLLLHAASGMAQEHNLERLLKLIAIIVLKTIKVNFVAIFLENKEQNNFEIKILRSFSSSANELLFSYDYEHPFINYIRHKENPFLFDEIPQYIANSVVLPFKVALVIPSFYEGVKGFMVIGEKNNKDIFTRDDINIFKMLARQTSLAMGNCLFFDEYKQAQEKIFTAEKLASIGGLAEGVAHQIRNRLHQFSVLTGDLKYEIIDCLKQNKEIADNKNLTETFDYLTKISESLETNVKKTNDVVSSILNYAKIESKQLMFEHFKFGEIVDLSFELLSAKHKITDMGNLKIIRNFKDDSTVFAVQAHMMEIVYNLIDNAYEAICEKHNILTGENLKNFVPEIAITLSKKDKITTIHISDNGIGVKEENLSKIFVPFFTTKSSTKSGTGIGMYIVKRIIVENLKGRIWIESTYMHGTDIFIELPNI